MSGISGISNGGPCYLLYGEEQLFAQKAALTAWHCKEEQ